MGTIAKKLAAIASSAGSIYKIVFTTMLLIELLKFKTKGSIKWQDSSHK